MGQKVCLTYPKDAAATGPSDILLNTSLTGRPKLSCKIPIALKKES